MTRFNSPISIPNILTLIRILLTPLFVILSLRQMYPQALLVFAAAGLSDGLDGLIARWMNQRTALGAYLDPLADKLLLVSAYVVLAVLGVIPAWVGVIVITRDVIILMGIAVLTLTEKKYDVRPSLLSKCTTAAQIFTVILLLYDPTRTHLRALYPTVLWITAALTILSGLHYIYFGMTILQDADTKAAGHDDSGPSER